MTFCNFKNNEKKRFKYRNKQIKNIVVHWNLKLTCENKCIYCYRFRIVNERKLILKEKLELISKIANDGVTHIFFTGGNPIDEDEVSMMIERATECCIYSGLDIDGRDVSLKFINSINGKLDCLGLPLDSICPLINNKLRGNGHHESVMKIIDHSEGMNFALRIHTVVTKENYNTLKELAIYISKKNISIWTLHELSPVFAKSDSDIYWYENNKIPFQDIVDISIELQVYLPNTPIRNVSEINRKASYLLITPGGQLYTHPFNMKYITYGSLLEYSLAYLSIKAGIDIYRLITSESLKFILQNGELKANALITDTDKLAVNNPSSQFINIIENQLVFRKRILRGIYIRKCVWKRAIFIQCDLSHTTFEDTDLYRIRFLSCQMYDTRFKNCNLTRSDFRSSNMYGIRLYDCDLTNAIFDTKVYSFATSLSNDRDSNTMKAETYGLLAKVKRDSLSYSEASNYRYLQKLAMRKTYRLPVQFIEYIFADISSCYGENPGRVALISGIVIVLFSLIYFINPTCFSPNIGSYIDALILSIISFSTIGFWDAKPVWSCKFISLLVSIESLLGPVFVALFLVAFVKRVLRD